MNKELKIKNLVGPYCGSRAEGEVVYSELIKIWDKYDTIMINFLGVEIATLSFFNAAFSPLAED